MARYDPRTYGQEETLQEKKEKAKDPGYEKKAALQKRPGLSFTLSARQWDEYDGMDESGQELVKYFMDDPSADVSKIDLSGERSQHSGSGRSLEEGTSGSAISSRTHEEEEKPTIWQRMVNTALGGWKNSAAGIADAGRVLYAVGQSGRTRALEDFRTDAQRNLEAAKEQLSNLLEDPSRWDYVETAKNYVDYWQQQYDAYDKVLSENVQQRATEETAALADSLQSSAREDLSQAKAGLGWLGQHAVDAGASFAQTAGDLLLGAPLGGGGGALPLLARSFGSAAMEARQGGGSLGQQIAYGGLSAGTELLTEALTNAAKPFKAAYGGGSWGLDRKLDELVALAVRKYAATPAGQRVLGGLLSAGKSFGMEGLEEFVGDWLQWQLPRIYGGSLNSISDRLASSLDSFFIGGLSGLYGAAADPGTYGYSLESDPGSKPVQEIPGYDTQDLPPSDPPVETEWQKALEEYDRSNSEEIIALSDNSGTIIPDEAIIKQSTKDSTKRFALRKRPTWRQSEIDVGLEFPDYSPQVSFLNGVEVPYGTPGSVRPDYYKSGNSIEVKNYNVTSAAGRSKLIRNILTHYQKRGTNMPANTAQTVVIDIRGQGLSQDSMIQLYTQLSNALGSDIQIRLFID